MSAAPEQPQPREVELTVRFKVGTLEQIGMGGLKVTWVEAERNGISYDLTSGAGLGNPYLEASASKDGRHVYAQANIGEVAQALFDALTDALTDGAP